MASTLHIEYSTEGGIAAFPGLAKPVTFDANDLGQEEAARLRRLIDDAHFFDQPATAGTPPRGAADYQYDVLTIDDGTKRHTMRMLAPIADPALQDLVQSVRGHVKSIRSAQIRARSENKPG